MTTTESLRVHMSQVHKEALRAVPNALEGRRNIDMVVFGMEGVPQELIMENHAKRRRTMNNEDEVSTSSATGGGGGGGGGANPHNDNTVQRFFYHQQQQQLIIYQ